MCCFKRIFMKEIISVMQLVYLVSASLLGKCP